MTGVQAHYPDRSVCINVSFIPHLLRSNLWLTDCLVLRDSAYLTSVRGTPKGQLRLLSVYAAFGGVVRYTSQMHGIWIGVSAEIWLVMAVNQPVWLVVIRGDFKW